MTGRTAALVLLVGVMHPSWLAAQCPDGSPPPCQVVAPRATPPAPRSVAVLYFDNATQDTTMPTSPTG
jgi:hypothetical protein